MNGNGDLRILLVGGDRADREAAVRALGSAFPAALVSVAEDPDGLDQALLGGAYDLVLAHRDLPWSSLRSTLRAVRSRNPSCTVTRLPRGAPPDRVVDIARRALVRHAERRAAREREARFRSLFDHLPVGIYRTTPQGRILDANPALARLLGVPDVGSLLAANVEDCYADPADRAAWRDRMERDGVVRNFVIRLRRPDGTAVWVSDSAFAVRDEEGRILCYEGALEDLTALRWAEETLRRREGILEALADAAQRFLRSPSWREDIEAVLAGLGSAADVDRVYIFENVASSDGRPLSAQRHEWVRDGIRPEIANEGMLPFDWRAHGVEQWARALEKGENVRIRVAESPEPVRGFLEAQDIRSILLVPIHVKGTWWGFIGFNACREEREWTAAEADVLRAAAGILGAAVLGRRVEEERLLLSKALEQAHETIVITDTEGTIVHVNPAFVRTTGYTAAEAVGRNPRILKSGEQDEAFYRGLWKTITSGKVWSGRFVNRRKDGSLYLEDAVISPVRDAAGRIVNYVGVKRDVTRDVELRRELERSQKLEALGRLAGGIAHDMNNVMAQVLGAAEILSRRISDPKHRPHLDLIRKAVERGRSITHRLLLFSREEGLKVEPVAAAELFEEVREVVKHTFPKGIRIVVDVPPEPLFLQANRGQMQQVLMNLCLNAADAMEDTGILTLAARPGSPGPPRMVRLTVSDTGAGMDRPTLERVFDPFYTTKSPGEGTGLGLYIAYGIVKAHGGSIDVRSRPGAGTTFTIELPACPPPAAPAEAAEMSAPSRGKGGTVLVVDDEPGILTLLEDILRAEGYRVLTARDGEAALEVLSREREGPDLVITDLGMPGMGGRDLVRRLRDRAPGLPILVSSGYVESRSFRELSGLGVQTILRKPFRLEEVLDAVTALIG